MMRSISWTEIILATTVRGYAITYAEIGASDDEMALVKVIALGLVIEAQRVPASVKKLSFKTSLAKIPTMKIGIKVIIAP